MSVLDVLNLENAPPAKIASTLASCLADLSVATAEIGEQHPLLVANINLCHALAVEVSQQKAA